MMPLTPTISSAIGKTALATASLLILVPVLLAFGLVWLFCAETLGRDLRDLEAASSA